jgi:protocatechuate 3,4-dioxygenase beta subunit
MNGDDHNVGRILSRRELLAMFGTIGTSVFLGCFSGRTSSARTSNSLPPCVVRPEQTEGPFFVDEKINRSDLRSDPLTGAVKQGLPLEIEFRVSQIGKNGCRPLPEAVVDVWHCDALGVYSDVEDRRISTAGQKFLRGYQVTDTNGIAKFTTIYPGWYEGRAVHIHFKIRNSAGAANSYEFTSQFFFDDPLSDKIYLQSPYSGKGTRRRLKNNQDGLYRNGGDQLLLNVTESKQNAYQTVFEIGLQIDLS